MISAINAPAAAQMLLPPDAAVTIGNVIPLDGLVDEEGHDFAFDPASRPWIVSPIYTGCLSTCLPITTALRSALGQSGLKPDEYRVVSLSFDPDETGDSLMAFRHKLQLPGRWLTLRAKDRAALERTLKALDFRTVTVGDGQFEHPNLIAILAPDGRLASYLFGVTFPPSQLAAAVRKARQGVSPVVGWAGALFAGATLGLVVSAFAFFARLSNHRRSQ